MSTNNKPYVRVWVGLWRKLSTEKFAAFWIVVLEKTLESPLDCKEIKPVNHKWNQSWVLVRRTEAEAEAPNFYHLMWRADSLEKILMLGKIEGSRRRGRQRIRWLDGITDSWVCVDSGSWWWTGKPGVLWSTGLQGLKESDSTERLNFAKLFY